MSALTLYALGIRSLAVTLATFIVFRLIAYLCGMDGART
jgi:hypothetical protein